jgi:hypothetical protein
MRLIGMAARMAARKAIRMRSRTTSAVAAVVLTAAAAMAASSALAADPSEFSEAERQLFVRPHLAAVTPPVRLIYRYERSGTLEPPVSDHAIIALTERDGARTAVVDYLTDDRRLELPPIGYVDGNPVILHFLEREVRELKRLTGGSVTFYRNRIRRALAENATVRDTQVDFDGKAHKAIEIRIDPYVNDPARSRFEKFADRYYVMVLSPDVPGEVFQLRAELAGPADARQPDDAVLREVLTFEGQENGK